MDDDDEEDEEEDVKLSTFAEAQPKIAEMTPEARADCTTNLDTFTRVNH